MNAGSQDLAILVDRFIDDVKTQGMPPDVLSSLDQVHAHIFEALERSGINVNDSGQVRAVLLGALLASLLAEKIGEEGSRLVSWVAAYELAARKSR